MSLPVVSIIVPNYNHSAFLKERLDSIFNQTFQDFEVILLDDASTDDSVKLLEQYRNHPKVSDLTINKENSKSPFKQWQKGIALAKGEYLWIAESDDYCELNFLEKLSSFFDKENGIIYSQSTDVNAKGETIKNRIYYTESFNENIWKSEFKISGKQFFEKYLFEKNVIPNASAVLFKRDLAANIFDSTLLNFKMLGDWLFWSKLCVITNVCFVSQSLNYFRSHDNVSRLHNTVTKQKQRLLEEIILRNYWYHQYSIISKQRNKELQKKWYQLHSKFDIFTTAFYKAKPTSETLWSFLSNYIKYKRRKQF